MSGPDGMDRPVVVSACLLGLACRYDGQAKASPAALAALSGRTVLPACPETAAGLGVPRPPFRFARGGTARVVGERAGLLTAAGDDVAPRLVPVCERLAARLVASGAREAILKARSPSCGVHRVYVGDALVAGRGVFAELLSERGVRLSTEEDCEEGRRSGLAAGGDATAGES